MITKTKVNYEKIDTKSAKTGSVQMLSGEIEGVNTYYHTVADDEKLVIKGAFDKYHVLFLLDGVVTIIADGNAYCTDKRGLYIAALGKDVAIEAKKCAHFCEFEMIMSENDLKKVEEYKCKFPIIQPYDTCQQYWDSSKSKKTINRIILEEEQIPRLALGSVESVDEDHVIPNSHPEVDQLFFTFEENETELIINNEKMELGGNVLLHIPLGSDHGSDVYDGKRMHYIWCDFLLGDESLEYLKTDHVKIDEKRSF